MRQGFYAEQAANDDAEHNVKPFKSPIRTLTFDPLRDMIAVGCGGDVWIYTRGFNGYIEHWDHVDHVPMPVLGPAGLVTALLFFRTGLGHSHLFIGYAKAGWSTWESLRNYKRMWRSPNDQTCTIGAAAVSLTRQFIAISTLENSIVTYALKENGPALDTKQEGIYQETIGYRPALPIVITPSGLIMKGTASSEIPIIDSTAGLLYSLHHGAF
ncbi:hypothetical protein FRC11_008324, partial [Ceratobasidium sp. 423]